MSEVFRSGNAVAAAGVVAEAVGAVITPGDGEGLKVHGIGLTSDLAGGLSCEVAVQESVNAGVAWADIFRVTLNVADGTLDLSDTRFLVASANRQARGSVNLQYRLVVYPGAIADVYSASLRGRTEK